MNESNTEAAPLTLQQRIDLFQTSLDAALPKKLRGLHTCSKHIAELLKDATEPGKPAFVYYEREQYCKGAVTGLWCAGVLGLDKMHALRDAVTAVCNFAEQERP
jgi:hypothetical protein